MDTWTTALADYILYNANKEIVSFTNAYFWHRIQHKTLALYNSLD